MSDHISTLEQPATIAANAALMVAKEGSDKKSGTGRRGQEKEPQHPAGISGGDAEAAAPASPKKPLAFHLSFLALNTMVFIVSLDATTLAVALPAIATELQGSTLEAFWAGISFTLSVTVTQPIYASFSDVLGRMAPLYMSFLLFTVGSVVFAVAKTMPVVICGRVLQGLGGGGLDVLGEIIIADMTTLKERPLYLGLLGLPMAAGSILGPLLGALFCQFATWRWIGWVNLPLVAVAFLLTLIFLRLRTIDGSLLSKLQLVDWVGLLLFSTGTTCFVVPLSWAGAMYPWSSWKTLTPLLVGVAVLVVFAFYETKPQRPVFPPRIFWSRTAVSTLFGTFIHGMLVYSGMQYLPLFFQAVKLETALQSAVSILPLSIVTVGFSCLSPLLVERLRRYQLIILLGWIFTAIGGGLLALLSPTSSLALSSSVQVIVAIGVGTLYCILIIPLQASVENVDDTGLAVGILVTFRLLGAVIGLAIGSTVFSSLFSQAISSVNSLPNDLNSELWDGNQAIGFIPKLRELVDISPGLLASILDTYLVSMRGIWYFMAAAASLGFITSLFTKDITLEKEDMGRQRFE